MKPRQGRLANSFTISSQRQRKGELQALRQCVTAINNVPAEITTIQTAQEAEIEAVAGQGSGISQDKKLQDQ